MELIVPKSETNQSITTTYTFYVYLGNSVKINAVTLSDPDAHFVKNKRESGFDSEMKDAQSIYMSPSLDTMDMVF